MWRISDMWQILDFLLYIKFFEHLTYIETCSVILYSVLQAYGMCKYLYSNTQFEYF